MGWHFWHYKIRLSVQIINAQRLAWALARIIDLCRTDDMESYGKTATREKKAMTENMFAVPAWGKGRQAE